MPAPLSEKPDTHYWKEMGEEGYDPKSHNTVKDAKCKWSYCIDIKYFLLYSSQCLFVVIVVAKQLFIFFL